MSKYKPKGYWSYERCFVTAKGYTELGVFKMENETAYQKARINGWLKDYTWLHKFHHSKGYWTYERCKEVALSCPSRGKFECINHGAYTKSRINGWLDEFFSINNKIK